MSRSFKCVCGQALFLRNSQCVACGRALGYVSQQCDLLPLEPGLLPEGAALPDGGLWRLARDEAGAEGLWQRCANASTAAACNWMVDWLPSEPPPPGAAPLEPAPRYCLCCRLNHVVPDWSDPARALNWGQVEVAKRRLVSALLELDLPVRPRTDEDPERGLMFDLLSTLPGGRAPMTGHDNGLITINIDEADDLTREGVRQRMGEPYRTVLGHLRHEVGHYYWDRLIAGTGWHQPYRELFGDESQDYRESLQRHYAQGPMPDWPMHHISAYASAHPWEDWAETWAHYMHMVDGLDTASSFGLNLASSAIEPVGQRQPPDPSAATAGAQPQLPNPDAPAEAAPAAAQGQQQQQDQPVADPAPAVTPVVAPSLHEPFDRLFEDWLRLTQAMNQMARSLGERDFYPFVVPDPVRRKLAFVHDVIGGAGRAG